ncbi:hypothetical protein [Bacillus alkalicellulosilyticus]|uniref:hypothetical protein n=1 Tax=Alkalihalobacterium alkalicellulosilyticum TaxID=1912214 RepID=UPI000998A8A3|nr:hypothetical protein [Bacillus alkalicellulosilyticus]
MVAAITILFSTAVGLLVYSAIKAKQTTKEEQQQIEQISISMMEEVQHMQQQLKEFELDLEITAQEAGLQAVSPQRKLMREVLDLHRRGYSNESIASQKQLSENEVESMLSPYIQQKVERREVSNAI